MTANPEDKKDLFFSDITEDMTLVTSSRTITEYDIMLFAGMTGDMSEVHTSATAAEETRYGERISHGLLTLSVAAGLYMRLGYFNRSAIAFLGIQDWTFSRPVKIGDTIHAKVTMRKKYPYIKPGQGVVEWNVKVINQRGETVSSGVWKRLIRERPETEWA